LNCFFEWFFCSFLSAPYYGRGRRKKREKMELFFFHYLERKTSEKLPMVLKKNSTFFKYFGEVVEFEDRSCESGSGWWAVWGGREWRRKGKGRENSRP